MMAHLHNRENCIMGNLLFLRRSYEYRHAAVAVFREARAMPMGRERNEARVLARGLRDLARTEAWLEGNGPKLVVSLLRGSRARVSEPDMSDSGWTTSEQSQFVRCVACWRWFDRSNSVSVSEHRGPLPHPVENPRTAWADEDE
jgi:hypothetical protein